MRETIKKHKAIILIFILSFIAYTSTLSQSLDDHDSINFALGIKEFDIVHHQPHPPGFPVYIFLGKIFNFFIGDEVVALTFMSALFGSLSLVVFYFFVLDMFDKKKALFATLLLAVTPMFWLNSLKAMADIPALFFILISFLFIYKYIKYKNLNMLYVASVLSGIAIGVRFHALFILLPLLIYAYFINGSKGVKRQKLIINSVLLFVSGILIWFVPMLLSQGIMNYFLASKTQFAWRLDNPAVSVLQTDITVDYLLDRAKDFISYFFIAGYGIAKEAFNVFTSLLLLNIVLLLILFIPKIKIKDERSIFFTIALIPYLLMIFLFLPPYNPRYLLPLIPVFSLVFVLSLWQFKKYKTIFFSVFLTLVLIQSAPLAIKIHNELAPPIQMINYIEENYDPDEAVLISEPSLIKHLVYYITDFTLINDSLSIKELLQQNKTVLAANCIYYNNESKLIKEFYRDRRIHVKHGNTNLCQIKSV